MNTTATDDASAPRDAPAAPSMALAGRLARHPSRVVDCGTHRVAIRETGGGPALVLLHGIGSNSASWINQFETLAGEFRLIAWDAPGYGSSQPLTSSAPLAADYALALRALVDALALDRFVLCAQSLGAVMAGAFARRWPERLHGLVLLAPARGYGAATAGERAAKLTARLDAMARLGPAGLARERAANLLRPNAGEAALEIVRTSMAALDPAGHDQAARLLAAADLIADAPHYHGLAHVACGSADTVTPEPGCRAIAAAFPRGSYETLPGLGHASYVDDPQAVNAVLRRFAAMLEQDR